MDPNLEMQREEFERKKKELSGIRVKLRDLHEQKEETFQKSKALREKMRALNSRIKGLKESRDVLTKQVKETKSERDKLNIVVKEKASFKKEADQKKQSLAGKVGPPESPRQIKEQIRRLETKLETEVMPFPKEQQLTKMLKELKARYKEMAVVEEAWKEVNTTAADFSEARRKAQELHHEVQKLAEGSQEKHEQVNQLYEELKKARGEEQPLAEKHLQLKVEYAQKKKELAEISARVDELAKLFHEEKEKSFRSKVREKTEEVKEKIKQRKKLSTEDILAFQALDE